MLQGRVLPSHFFLCVANCNKISLEDNCNTPHYHTLIPLKVFISSDFLLCGRSIWSCYPHQLSRVVVGIFCNWLAEVLHHPENDNPITSAIFDTKVTLNLGIAA